MAGSAGGNGEEPEFQVAPMIDVLLVLLVFFMSITSAQVLKIDKNLTLPVSPNAKQRDPELQRLEVAVNVRWDTSAKKSVITVDDRVFADRAEFVSALEARLRSNPKTRALIRGDRALPAIEVRKVVDLIGRAGVGEIAFAATNK